MNEYRTLIAEGTPGAGGYTVPSNVSAQYIDALKAQSTFFRALPAGNVLSFDTDALSIPQLVESDGEDYTGRHGRVIPSDGQAEVHPVECACGSASRAKSGALSG